jgi:hypothetical protein
VTDEPHAPRPDDLARLRALVASLDDAGCNWAPDEDAPSVAAALVARLDPTADGPAIVRSRRALLALLDDAAGAPALDTPNDAPLLRRLTAEVAATADRYHEARRRAGVGLRPFAAPR